MLMSRRTTSWAAATALLFSGVLLSGCGVEEDPSATPAETRTITVPADFPLTVGMRPDEPGADRIGPTPSATGLDDLTVCGVAMKKFRGDDRLGANGIGPMYSEDRAVISFGSVADAAAVLTALRDAAGTCPTDENGQWKAVPEDLAGNIGDEAVTLGEDFTGEDISDVLQVTRVGRGVLMLREFRADTGERVAQLAPQLTKATRAIVPAMCVFTSAGCETDIPPHADGAPFIPDDFPLAAGLPTRPAVNFTAPTHRDLGGADLSLCSQYEGLPDPRDRLQTQLAGDTGESRALNLYPDEAAATAALAKLRSELADCPVETVTDRSGASTQVANAPLELRLEGDYVAWANENKIEPEIGFVVLRRGAALLIMEAIREAPNPGPPMVDRLTQPAQELAKEMCLFTAAGC
jgi:hypothetical protein